MSREWYFVRQIREHERPGSLERFEIQRLGEDGRAIAVGHLSDTTAHLSLDGQDVPPAVIESARLRPVGEGEYVGSDGKRVAPF